MAMNPQDLRLRNGERQPTQPVRTRGTAWKGHERRFQHAKLAAALATLALPKTAKP